MVKVNLRTWSERCRLHEVETRGFFKTIDSDEDVAAFARVCHDLVLDRSASFTIKDRIRLYKRWLASGQPCLVAAHDAGGHILAASIVLPLTQEAFRAFWHDGLDALDIWPNHIAAATHMPRYFLVDMLAANGDFIKRTAVPGQASFCGIGFRTLIFHLSLFGRTDQVVLLCSTFSKELSALLRAVGFEQRVGQGDLEAPIFRADLAQRDLFSVDALKLIDDAAKVAAAYSQASVKI